MLKGLAIAELERSNRFLIPSKGSPRRASLRSFQNNIRTGVEEHLCK